MSLDDSFQAAADRAQKLDKQSNDTLLQIYALYKQAQEGDVTGKRPGGFDFRGQAKYDAWAKLKGTSQEDAKQQYIDLIDRLAGS